MSFLRIYALRGIAVISLFSGLTMASFCGILFGARVEDLSNSKFSSYKVPQNISDSHIHTSEKEQEAYENVLQLLNNLWIKNRPLLLSCSMLAIFAGLLQIIFSCMVFLSDSKAIRLYIKKWVTVHFILVCVLFIILLNAVILSENTVEKQSWEYLTSRLRKYLKAERPLNDYSELYRYLGTGQRLIYISVGTNLGMILVLMSAMLVLMRNQQGDYESCD